MYTFDEQKSPLVQKMSRAAELVKVLINAVNLVHGDEEIALHRLFDREGGVFLPDLGRFLMGWVGIGHYPAPSEFLCPDRIPKGYEIYSDVAPTGDSAKDLTFVNCVSQGGEPVDGFAFKCEAAKHWSNYGLADADRWLKQGELPSDPVSQSTPIALTGTILEETSSGLMFIPVLFFNHESNETYGRGWMVRLQRVYTSPLPSWSSDYVVFVA